MGTNASIPLSVTPPPINNPVQTLGGVVSLQDALARRPLIQEQTRAAQLENTQRESQARAQQSLNQAMAANVSIGPDGFPVLDHGAIAKHLAQSGAGSAIPGYLQGALKTQQEHANATKAELANRAALLEQSGQLLQGVKDDEGYQAVLPALRGNAKQLGIDPSTINPNYDKKTVDQYVAAGMKAHDFTTQAYHHADLAFRQTQARPKTAKAWSDEINQDLASVSSPGQLEAVRQKWTTLAGDDPAAKEVVGGLIQGEYSPDIAEQARRSVVPVKDQPKFQQTGLQLAVQQLSGASDAEDYQERLAKLAPAIAAALPDAPREGEDFTAFMKRVRQAGMTATDQAKTEQAATKSAAQATHWGAMERIGQQNANTRARTADAGASGPSAVRDPSIPGTQRDEGVIAKQPPGLQNVIKRVVDYKYVLPTGSALGKPYWQNVLQLAAEYDPSFDASQYQTRMALRRDFTSGKSASKINALNTVAQHLDRLEDNWQKLNNYGGAGTALNAPVNWVGSKLDSGMQNRVNRFQLAQDAVSNELMRVWREVGASEGEIKNWAAKLSPNLSPEAQRGAIAEMMQLIKGKLQAQKSQYENAMGRPADFKLLQPETRERFQKHGVDVEDFSPNSTYPTPAGNGSQPQSPASAQAPAGIPAATVPHKVGDVRQYRGQDYKFDGTDWIRQ